MDSVDWKQVLAAMTIIGLYTHMVIEWIKQKNKVRQICHYLGLDEDGNPLRDGTGRVRRQIDSDVVREIFRDELKKKHAVPDVIQLPRADGESA